MCVIKVKINDNIAGHSCLELLSWIQHRKDAKSGENGEHARPIFPTCCATFYVKDQEQFGRLKQKNNIFKRINLTQNSGG